jgi:CRP/FNR family transcriptional regulator, cyclic AMP receptor protein
MLAPPKRSPVVRQRNILASLGARDLELLMSKCSRKLYRRRAKLYIEGTPHRATYFIESGLIRTFYESPAGKEITLGYWSTGDMIGGPYFFDDTGIHVWSAEVVENSVVLAVSGRDLREMMMKSPRLASAVLDAIAFKLLWDSLLLQALATQSVSTRLAVMLVRISALFGEATPDGIVLGRGFTQEKLANMVGTTREWLNAQLKQLQRDGLVCVKGRRIVITDLARLKDASR